MPPVFLSIADSILSGHKLPYLLSTSTKTGLSPFHFIEWAAAIKEKGEVIISPLRSSAFWAMIRPLVALLQKLI